MAGIALAGLATCTRCARLVACRRRVSPVKGRSRADYHNAPVNGFGDLRARIGLIGLAPGAHGANRTGRPFTGDGAGDFMYPLLHQAGLASQPQAVAATDGLTLHDLYITNAVKCLPPQNRPNAAEFDNCRSYLAREIAALRNLRVLIGLGHGAFRSLLRYFQDTGLIHRLGDFPFGHGRAYSLSNGLWLLGCYHTSRYNVQTGRMTAPMFHALMAQARLLAEGENS